MGESTKAHADARPTTRQENYHKVDLLKARIASLTKSLKKSEGIASCERDSVK